MPRDGSGNYTKAAGTTAVPNTVIESAKYNAAIDDIAADLNLARPVVAGGTGASSVAAAQTSLSLDNKVVYASKSSGYTALATDNNAVHRFTASATVALTAAATLGANWHYTAVADGGGSVIIDPNGSETINGLSTLVIPIGSSAEIICDGSNFFAVTKPSIGSSIGSGIYTVSAASALSITDLGGYRKIWLSGFLYGSALASISVRTSSNNGSSYDSGASDYGYQLLAAQGSGASAAAGTAASLPLATAAVLATVNDGLQFSMEFDNFNQASYLKANGTSFGINGSGVFATQVGAGRLQATARNALQILASTGTITGIVYLSGQKG